MSDDEIVKFLLNFFISGTTSVVCKTIVAPIDRIKLIIQNQDSALQVIMGTRKKYTGIINVILRIPKEQGFRSFWRGNGTNLIRYFPAQALNFSFKDVYTSFFETYTPNFKSKPNFLRYASGGFAGMTSTIVIYPLEFCQTKVTADVGSDFPRKPNSGREYVGLVDCIRKVSKKDGITGLYRGMMVTVFGCGVYRALYFGLFDDLKALYDDEEYSLKTTFVIAQTSSAVSGFISYPLDTIGRRLMMDSGRPVNLKLHRTYYSAVRHIYQQEGLHGFFKGWVANILRSLGGAMVLVSYDYILYYTNWKDLIESYFP